MCLAVNSVSRDILTNNYTNECFMQTYTYNGVNLIRPQITPSA